MIRPESSENDKHYDLPDGWIKRVVLRKDGTDHWDVYLTPPEGFKPKSGRKHLRSSTELQSFLLHYPDCPIDPLFVNMNRSPEAVEDTKALSPNTRKLLEFLECRKQGIVKINITAKKAAEGQQKQTKVVAKAAKATKPQKMSKDVVKASASKKEASKTQDPADVSDQPLHEKKDPLKHPETKNEPSKKASKNGELAKKAAKMKELSTKAAGSKRPWRLGPSQKRKAVGNKKLKTLEPEPESEPEEHEVLPQWSEVTFLILLS